MNASQTTPRVRRGQWMKRYYFSLATAALLFLTVWGFSDNLLWRVDQPSNRDPKFIIHGSFCLAWMLVLFSQANLIRKRNVEQHRRLGVVGFLLAIGVTFSTAFVFASVWRPWAEMSVLVQGNRLLLAGFAALVVLAYRERRRPPWHKRYILIASFFMLEPVLSRAFNPLEPLLTGFTTDQVDRVWWVFFVASWGALFLSLFAYDRTQQAAVHGATKRGVALFCAIWIAVFLV